MKSSLSILAALAMLALAHPAAAMSSDHDSAYANASGGSRFSDPDDALTGNDGNSNSLGTVQFGNADSGSVSFGMSTSEGGSNPTATPPGYYGIYDPTRQR